MVPPTEARTEVLARKPQAIGWLVVVQGPYPGREFRLQDGTTIGRSGDNDVILDDPSVSRQHAKVRLEGQTFILHDLGATNPTKVNGQEISKQPLSDGDRVEIGNVVLVFKQVQLP
jgi:pSer/pThr/pTyr-binding forkhead associated (FHA) protein